jgi:hemoglobin/transferrin/lactoferrin receptor protein
LPLALRDVPGVHIQQTTSGQGSPFVRGLTGQQVVHLINGVRFNNSTFRPGANQYTA